MKRYIKLIVTTAIVAILGLTAGLEFINNNNQVPEGLFMAQAGNEIPHDLRYNLNANTDHIPSKEEMHIFVQPNIKDNDVKGLAAKFGLDGTLNVQGNRMFIQDKNDKKKHFEIDKETGYYSYLNFNKLGNIDIEKNIPEDDTAIAKVKEYLNERGLLPERFNIIKVTNRTMGEKLTGTERIVSKEVWFYPTVDGKPVYGISRIIVSVGHEGEIEAVRKYHREIESSIEIALKPFNQAFDELKQGKASIRVSEKAKNVNIKKVDIGYWEDPNEDQLHPVYVFEGEATTDDGKTEPFDAFLPAGKGVEMEIHPNTNEQEIPDTEKIIQ